MKNSVVALFYPAVTFFCQAQFSLHNCGLELSHAPACAPLRDAEVPKAATVGFVFGALAASASYWIKKRQEERMQPNKVSHP